MNPGLARALGVMLKLDFQRAVLQRIPKIAAQPKRRLARPAVRLRRVPRLRHRRRNGPDRRRARVRAVPPGAADSDRGDAEHQLTALRAARRRELAHAAPVLPHEGVPGDQRRVHRANRRGAVRSSATGSRRATRVVGVRPRRAHLAPHRTRRRRSSQSLSASKSYASQPDYVVSRLACSRELQNAQAIVLPYDGLNPLPPQYCYLKPHYLDVQTSYFDHLARGAL